MKIDKNSKTQAHRDSWRRNHSRCQSSHTLRINRPPQGPPVSFAELVFRLSRGRLGSKVARDLLRIEADHVSLNIRIDRDTGLVANWTLRTEGASAPNTIKSADEMAPAA